MLLLKPLIVHSDSKSWLLLAAASTLFASVANLIVAEAAIYLEYKLTFWQHLRFGLPLTVLTLIFAYLWIH